MNEPDSVSEFQCSKYQTWKQNSKVWTQETLIYNFIESKNSQNPTQPYKFFHACYPLEVSQYVWLEGRPNTMWCHFTKTTQVWKIRLNLTSVRELYGFIPHYTCFLTHMHEEQYHWVLSLKPGFERRSPFPKFSSWNHRTYGGCFGFMWGFPKFSPLRGNRVLYMARRCRECLPSYFHFGDQLVVFLVPYSESSW